MKIEGTYVGESETCKLLDLTRSEFSVKQIRYTQQHEERVVQLMLLRLKQQRRH